MNYWILQYNSATLSDNCPHPPQVPPNIDYWCIRYYANKASIGDIAFIWHAGSARGIYNVATIVSVPPHSSQAGNWIRLMWESDRPCYVPDAFTRLGQYEAILVERKYQGDLQPLILLEELQQQGFSNLPVIRMPQSGIYRLDQTVGERLLEYIERTRGRRQ